MNNSPNRTLIENGLPIGEISKAAKREKLGRPKSSEMHYYWTRKPLITARAAVLGALLPNDFPISKFLDLLGLNNRFTKKPYLRSYTGKEIQEIHRHAKTLYGDPISMFDPFGGAGSIPLEAVRLKLNVTSNDYNPLATLIQKITLLYPLKCGSNLIDAMSDFFNELRGEIIEEIKQYYPNPLKGEKVLGYFYSWAIDCPFCTKEIPLVGSWGLGGPREDKNKKYLEPSMNGEGKITFKIKKGPRIAFPAPTITRGKGRCLFCNMTISNEEIIKGVNQQKKEWLLAVAYRNEATVGGDYRLPNENDMIYFRKFNISDIYIDTCFRKYIPTDEIPIKVIRSAKYLGSWDNLFQPRQLIYIASVCKLGDDILSSYQNNGKYSVELIEGLCLGLSCLLAKIIDRNCRTASWDFTTNKVSHLVAFRTYPLMWSHFETHPIEGRSGSLDQSIKSVLEGLQEAVALLANSNSTISILNSSITSGEFGSYNLIVTDPPYFDDVPYPEVSEVFYIWQKSLLEKYLPEMYPNVPPRDEELSSNLHDRSNDFVKIGLQSAFSVLNQVLDNNGLLIMFFAHSKLEAWEFVLNALVQAEFQITATYPLQTESSVSVIASGKASIFSSILIVCRKRLIEKIGVLEDIETEIGEVIQPRLEDFWKLGLRHADLTGAAIGPVLEVITSYSSLRSRTGQIDVMDLLALASKHVITFVLAKYLRNTNIDSGTAFYLYMIIESDDGGSKQKQKDLLIPYDSAHILSKSMNLDLGLLERTGLIDNGEGTNRSKNRVVRLLGHDMRPVHDGELLIDGIHVAMKAFTIGGVTGMREQLKEKNLTSNQIRPVLELIARSSKAPGLDSVVAQKMLGLRDQLQKAPKTLTDYLND